MPNFFETDDDKKWLIKLLRESSVDVGFIKKDGSQRQMKATLNTELIPHNQSTNKDGSDKIKSTLVVFDLEKQSWRSFSWDSVNSISFRV